MYHQTLLIVPFKNYLYKTHRKDLKRSDSSGTNRNEGVLHGLDGDIIERLELVSFTVPFNFGLIPFGKLG